MIAVAAGCLSPPRFGVGAKAMPDQVPTVMHHFTGTPTT
jgi:hypothetical protein